MFQISASTSTYSAGRCTRQKMTDKRSAPHRGIEEKFLVQFLSQISYLSHDRVRRVAKFRARDFGNGPGSVRENRVDYIGH